MTRLVLLRFNGSIIDQYGKVVALEHCSSYHKLPLCYEYVGKDSSLCDCATLSTFALFQLAVQLLGPCCIASNM